MEGKWDYGVFDYRNGFSCNNRIMAIRDCEKKGIIQSMSRKGNCIDNCIMESFFGTIKNKMLYGHESELKRLAIYIEQ